MTTFTMNAQKPVAYDSPDHIQPWGTVNDNSINYCFNLKLMWWLPRPYLKVLDLGCAGGGFVKSLINSRCVAVGVEGSDYSQRMKRAEWATIPGNLFTADATAPFEISVHEGDRCEPMKFTVVTAWEFIEHIAEPNLDTVMRNIDRHLAPNGVVIMSVSPRDEIINGVRLHQTVAEKPWWLAKFESLGFTHHESVAEFFHRDWVRGGEDAPDSFYVVLTRRGESLPYPEQLIPLTEFYAKLEEYHPGGSAWFRR